MASPPTVTPLDRTTLRVMFPAPMRVERLLDLSQYVIRALGTAYPLTIEAIEPIYPTVRTGTGGVVASASQFDPGVPFSSLDVGSYLFLSSDWNWVPFARILGVSGQLVTLDASLVPDDPLSGSIPWSQAVITGITITTTGATDLGAYELQGFGLTDRDGAPYAFTAAFTGLSSKPRVVSAVSRSDGSILVTFDRPMRSDEFLTSPDEYSVSIYVPPPPSRGKYGTSLYGKDPYGYGSPRAPTQVPRSKVAQVIPVSDTQVALRTLDLLPGTQYVVTVNAFGTPHDAAGNPIDPAFNQAIFTGTEALYARSIYVNKGPIARPPLTLQAGVGMSFTSANIVTITGGGFGPNLTGLYITLGGTEKNDGTYQILAVLTTTKLRLKASFTLPDANQLLASWSVFDPRDGEIADDPGHVTVRINGVPTRPEAVVGLLGQIVMPTAPGPTDDVKVDYAWVRNPTVEIRRLNSREFRLNNWNTDIGRLHDASGHKYRYNNVLPVPAHFTSPTPFQSGTNGVVFSATRIQLNDGNALPSFVGLNITILTGPNAGTYDIMAVPDSTHVDIVGLLALDPVPFSWTIGDTSDIQATLPQPLQRDLKYRAYERAYTAVLNDPNTLRLNSPKSRIAYPPLQRTVRSSFINYEPTGLPENDATAPWNRVGVGNVTVIASELSVTPVPTPVGSYIYWNRSTDLTFPHVYAATWKHRITTTPTLQGVFTGVAFGYSDNLKAIVVGYILDGTTAKIGFLKKGSGNNPALLSAWTGGLDAGNNPTGAPITLDWSILHSFRIYQDPTGTVKLYLDGEIVENMRVTLDELPYLEELDTPFTVLQGVYFGSLARDAVSTAVWDFVRYTVLPLNPLQTAPSIFVSYEGNILPEASPNPWTPIGYHGTETILLSDFLLLDSTSALSSSTTYIGGAFRGFVRLEPLLATDAEVVLDIDMSVRTWTHGVAPDAITAIIDDSDRFIQLSFLADVPMPKFSYGGDVIPTALTPPWVALSMGSPTARMVGRSLRVTNTVAADGLLYIFDDNASLTDPARVLGDADQILEARLQPVSYTPDLVTGFAGATAQVYNSDSTLGFYLADNAGIRSIVIYGIDPFGLLVPVATIPFEWRDGAAHTYRLVRSYGGGLVTLFIDGTLVAVENYSSFPVSPSSPVGYVSFGSSVPGSTSVSTVDWVYCNAWRSGPIPTQDPIKHYVGIWKGRDPNDFTGYHLPTKVVSRKALVVGNALADSNVDLVTAGVVAGDLLVVDDGPNKGTYRIVTRTTSTLTIDVMWPQQPSSVAYRIIKETDWTAQHRYRIIKDPAGSFITVMLDADPAPLLVVDYDYVNLPPSARGLPRAISGTVPSILWGALDPTNLSQTYWDYVRYGVTRSPTELRIAPHHQVLNQRNVIASPEHLTTDIKHDHTDFWSSSTGIPPHKAPDFLDDPNLIAFTLLNEGTPLVPSTEAFEVRHPMPVKVFVGGLNSPANVLNNNGFKLNEPGMEVKLLVPDDVLYSQLKVIERDSGALGLLATFTDTEAPTTYGPIFYTKEVCLAYDGSVLPENDPTASTPWVFDADNVTHVVRSAFAGVLTYGTDGVGTKTIYRNATPLPDAIALGLEVTFRMKVLSDGSGGLADSQIRFGFSAFGMTLALAFITAPTGLRYVICYDLASETVIGGTPFDFYDGLFHTYRIVRAPGSPMVRIFIDS